MNDEKDVHGGNFQGMKCLLCYTSPVHVFNLRNKKGLIGESMKKKASCAKVKVPSNDYIFHIVVSITFFTLFIKLNIKFKAKYDTT